MTRLVFSSEAEADVLAAFRFYEDRREGLGERFRDHVGIYRVYPGLVYVVAVMHAKQNPAIWKRRASGGEPG